MKILIVNTFYYPNMVGGTENSVKILSENLVKEGNKVAVYTLDATEQFVKETINGVQIYRGKNKIIQNNRLLKKFFDINNILIKKQIRKVIEDFKPDLIHTNNLYGISNIIWKIAKKEYNIPIIHTLRDYWMLYPIVSKEKISKLVFQPFMRKRTKYVDIVTAPSNYTLNKFIEAGYFSESKKQCIYNAININIKETKEIIQKRNIDNKEKIKFMYVGMLIENKGIRNLLEAFSKIKNENISLHIYGKGELENIVKQRVKENHKVKYYGQLSTDKLKNEWLKNDVLIVPSIWEEPFGRVVIEANQYGLPVIGANRAGILETITNIQTGLLYQYDNIEELVKAIQYFENRDNIKKYYKAIEDNIEKYSIENQIKEFMKLYKNMVNITLKNKK